MGDGRGLERRRKYSRDCNMRSALTWRCVVSWGEDNELVCPKEGGDEGGGRWLGGLQATWSAEGEGGMHLELVVLVSSIDGVARYCFLSEL
jgi:hypothetical protein